MKQKTNQQEIKRSMSSQAALKKALAQAILTNQLDTVNQLLLQGGDPNAVILSDNTKLPLLGLALQFARDAIALALLKAGANADAKVEIESGKKSSILVLCISQNINQEVMLEMIKKGANFNEVLEVKENDNEYFHLPMRLWHYFCLKGDKDVVSLLTKNCDNLLLSTSDDPSSFSILELLESKKYPLVQKEYAKCSVALEKKMASIKPLLSMLDIFNISNKESQGPRASIEMGMFDQLLSAVSIAKTYRELFEGGNKNHHEICQLISKMVLEKSDIPHKNPSSSELPKPLSVLSSTHLFAPKTEKVFLIKKGSHQVPSTHQNKAIAGFVNTDEKISSGSSMTSFKQ